MSDVVDVTKLPMAYRCLSCDAEGVRLWRDYSTFLSHITLVESLSKERIPIAGARLADHQQ